MYSKAYRKFINSEEWQDIRQAKLEASGWECERCGWQEDLQVHHRHYNMEFGRERNEDLMVLCKDCHKLMHDDIYPEEL